MNRRDRLQELHREIEAIRAEYCRETLLPPRLASPNHPNIEAIQARYDALLAEYRRLKYEQ